MTKFILILVIGLVFEAIGVVLLSKGLANIGSVERISGMEIIRIVKRGAANKDILLGIACEAIFFGTLLVLMSRGDISFVWPLTALGFVLTTLAAKFVRHEEVSGVRWAGVILIVMGAGLIIYSEKLKGKGSNSPPGKTPSPDAARLE